MISFHSQQKKYYLRFSLRSFFVLFLGISIISISPRSLAETCTAPDEKNVYEYKLDGETICIVSTLSKKQLHPKKLINKFKKLRIGFMDFFEPSDHDYTFPKTSTLHIQIYATTPLWRKHLTETYPDSLFESANNVGGYYQRDTSTIHVRYFEPQEGLGDGFVNSIVHEYAHHLAGLIFKPDLKDFQKKFIYNPQYSYVWLVEGLADYLMVQVQNPGDETSRINKLRIFDDFPFYLQQKTHPLRSLMQEDYSVYDPQTKGLQVNPRPYIYGSVMFHFFIQNDKHTELMKVIETLYKPSFSYNNQSRELYNSLARHFGSTTDKIENAFTDFLKDVIQDRPIIPRN